MASSLKELAKKKLLVEMIRSIQPASKWKILITDPNSVDIINSVCRLNEVLDENVTCKSLFTF
jgi:syntaxin-binding protein 1